MKNIEGHYSDGRLLDSIKEALARTGKEIDALTTDDLSAVDEFHIGGRIASEHFFPQFGLKEGDEVIDVGAGIGGGARFAAERYGVNVTGIDLTREFVETGNQLNEWVGLSDRVDLRVGDATSLDIPDETFDAAFTMHVFMNIPDKRAAFDEVFRVLKPGGVFGLYDITKYGEKEIHYPVPWATDASMSFLATIDEYVDGLEASGFSIEKVTDRHEFAVGFFTKVLEKLRSAGGPPPLGIHLHMGAESMTKVENITANLVEGLIAPFEIFVKKQ